MARSCESCGIKMPAFRPRMRTEDGRLVCSGCHPDGQGGESRPVGHHGSVESGRIEDFLIDHLPHAAPRAAGACDRCRGSGRVAGIKGGSRTCPRCHGIGTVAGSGKYVCGDCGYYSETPNPGVCPKCFSDEPFTKIGNLQVEAHDSGDGETIYHCPFCGGGQVTGRSDGTVECDFCNTAFTVQVQPEKSGQPQTFDGQPMEMPGMPGEVGGTPENAIGGEEQTTSEGAPHPAGPPGDINAEFAVLLGEGGGGEVPPQFKESFFLGGDGVPRDVETYVRHLAVLHADDRSGVLQALRDENRGESSRRP